MPKYSIPIRDSLVVGHADPDGDSLSSVKAVLGHIRAGGKRAMAKVCGKVPDHLAWILPEEDLVEDMPDAEQTIILDCGPDRVGFEVVGLVLNIDHHDTRKGEHDPKTLTYVLDRCSVAAALILDFGLRDDILLVGLYDDTKFFRSWGELNKCFRLIKVSDERAHALLSACRPTRYKKALVALKSAETYWCKNRFLLAEIEESDPVVVSEVMETLFRYSESVCLIDGSGRARLRTSNEALDLGAIAKMFGGGGHPFAAACDTNGRRTAFVGLIKQQIGRASCRERV